MVFKYICHMLEKGQLFGWGSNDTGQVNPDSISTIYYEPVHIKLPRRIGKIVDVALGDMVTFVVNGKLAGKQKSHKTTIPVGFKRKFQSKVLAH